MSGSLPATVYGPPPPMNCTKCGLAPCACVFLPPPLMSITTDFLVERIAELDKELAAVTQERDEERALKVEALKEARPHVLRQLNGRHEQDREDAHVWLEKWGK